MSAPKVEFYEALAELLEVGFNLNLALTQLSKIKRFKHTAHLVQILIQNGHPLSKALYCCGADTESIQCIETGEKTGNMHDSLKLAIHLKTYRKELYQTFFSILKYPVFVLLLSCFVLIFLNLFMLPNFQKMFAAQQKDLPPLTEFVFQHNYLGFVVIIILIACVSASFYPILSKQKWILFCLTIGSKLKAGIHLSQCLKNNLLDLIERGYPISTAMQVNAFPTHLIQIIELGEAGGTLDKSFLQGARLYQSQLDHYLNRLKSILPSLLLMATTGIVGVIIAAMYLPLLAI